VSIVDKIREQDQKAPARTESVSHEPARPAPPAAWLRWLPLATAVLVTAAVLVAAGTSPVDILKYAAYAILTVIVPGTLVFRVLRRHPHTLVEDLAFGTAIGLTLELAGWALLSALDLRAVMWLWPALVYVPFLAVPALRRHWWVRDYPTRPSQAWSWTVAGAVSFFSLYLYGVFFSQNPILPDSEESRQFLDLPYQLSLAAEAKRNFPLDLPQVAGEPLHYHWFAFVHIAMGSLVGGIDLPVLTMRLMVPAVCALTTVLLAVVTWRITGRPVAGALAALLFAVIGDFDFAAVPWPPFGTQVTFVIWPSLSMTYSWALLVGLIGAIADRIPRGDGDSPIPAFGRGAWVMVALLAVASSAAKASSLPVALGGLALAGAAVLVLQRRISWPVVALGAAVAGAQLFALALVFAFKRYGLAISPFANINWYWQVAGRNPVTHYLIVAAVFVAFVLHLQLRAAGILPLAWFRRGRLTAVQWFLLGGAITGPALFLIFSGYAATWFTRAGFPFSLVLSAWGFALVVERASLSRRGRALLAAFGAVFAVVLTAIAWRWAPSTYPVRGSYGPIIPMLVLAATLAGVALVGGIAWRLAERRWPVLHGKGGAVLLLGVLFAGAPGLPLDVRMSWGVPGGPYEEKVPVAASQVDAARWVRDHSDPTDIVATNQHCTMPVYECDNYRSFWLSAYSERAVLVEGWSFAPRVQPNIWGPFWDPDLLDLNDRAFYDPTPAVLEQLAREHGVRYLVAVRAVRAESPDLASLATLAYDNGKVAVYELG
jgi:hypothetical protein